MQLTVGKCKTVKYEMRYLSALCQEHGVRAFSYLNCFKTLPRKHMASLLRNEHGLKASAGFKT